VPTSEYIAIAGVLASLVSALVTWLVMKRKFSSKRLSYAYEIEPIVRSGDPDLARDLKVFFRGEELPEPALLSVTIANTGYTAIEDATVVIKLPGAMYLIPGYFLDVPAGYDLLWDIERSDAEECTIKFKHINPKQIAKVRLLMDEIPDGDPAISCPMPNVECVKATTVPALIAREVLSKLVGV
jgi:hypothetical protein